MVLTKLLKAYSNYWFFSLRRKVQVHIDNCLICLLSNSTVNTREGELQMSDNPTHPFQTIHIDHFGPLNQTDNGSKHILLVVDAFSRFTWLFATKSTGSKEVVKYLSTLFDIFGNPQILVERILIEERLSHHKNLPLFYNKKIFHID